MRGEIKSENNFYCLIISNTNKEVLQTHKLQKGKCKKKVDGLDNNK